MTYTNLFEYSRARATDPATSKEAGSLARRLAQADQRSIVRALTEAGRAMAAEEISDHLGWGDHVRVNRRLSELTDQSAIERTDERHQNRSGRHAFRYRVIGGVGDVKTGA